MKVFKFRYRYLVKKMKYSKDFLESKVKINEESDLVFLRNCPYFKNEECKSICWNLKGPCGVCVENKKYNPRNATKERLDKVVNIHMDVSK